MRRLSDKRHVINTFFWITFNSRHGDTRQMLCVSVSRTVLEIIILDVSITFIKKKRLTRFKACNVSTAIFDDLLSCLCLNIHQDSGSIKISMENNT